MNRTSAEHTGFPHLGTSKGTTMAATTAHSGRVPRRAAVAVAITALLVTGCTATTGSDGPVQTAVPTPSSTTTATEAGPPPPAPTTPEPVVVDVDLFWIDGNADSLVPRPRTVTSAEDSGTGRILAALGELLDGPDADEAAAGLSTAIPDDVSLLGVDVTGSDAAPVEVTVDLSSEFEAGGGSTAMVGRLAQVTWTATQEGSVTLVRLAIEGQPVEVFSGEGIEIGDGMTRDDFGSAFRGRDAAGPTEPTPEVVPVWGQAQIGTRDPGDDDWMTVVDVAADDTLNVRVPAGPTEPIVGRLRPGVEVPVSGATTQVGGSTWYELRTPAGSGWAHGAFLAPVAPSPSQLATMARPVIDEFARRLRDGRDVADLVARGGLHVAHHAAPEHFPADEVDDAIDDPTRRTWGSNAIEPGNPELPLETFREAVADPFVSVWLDDDTEFGINMVLTGPNGRLESHVVPSEFAGLPFVAALDPGDNPQFGGLDWQLWVVSLVEEDGAPRIHGLTLDEWAP